MGPASLVAGVALLALTVWWRAAPSSGRTRWWTRVDTTTRAALMVLPGIALMLIAGWPLSTYDREMAEINGDGWKLWFGLVFAVGAVISLWAMLFLPIPALVKPRWFRETTPRRQRTKARTELTDPDTPGARSEKP